MLKRSSEANALKKTNISTNTTKIQLQTLQMNLKANKAYITSHDSQIKDKSKAHRSLIVWIKPRQIAFACFILWTVLVLTKALFPQAVASSHLQCRTTLVTEKVKSVPLPLEKPERNTIPRAKLAAVIFAAHLDYLLRPELQFKSANSIFCVDSTTVLQCSGKDFKTLSTNCILVFHLLSRVELWKHICLKENLTQLMQLCASH